ncbi:hypothetical protein PtrSN002B_002839, partial [Pyrenophora tritici-repentis]
MSTYLYICVLVLLLLPKAASARNLLHLPLTNINNTSIANSTCCLTLGPPISTTRDFTAASTLTSATDTPRPDPVIQIRDMYAYLQSLSTGLGAGSFDITTIFTTVTTVTTTTRSLPVHQATSIKIHDSHTTAIPTATTDSYSWHTGTSTTTKSYSWHTEASTTTRFYTWYIETTITANSSNWHTGVPSSSPTQSLKDRDVDPTSTSVWFPSLTLELYNR